MDSWAALKDECSRCRDCKLCDGRKHIVFGDGNESARIMFIGEGPGEQEDLQGLPFVGAAGQLLDTMLSLIDVSRENSYIANIVKCRPPMNRDPQDDEKSACIKWVMRQIELVNPKIIVCLGRISAQMLIDTEFKITRQHGEWFEKDGRLYTAIYHPSALLRDAGKRPETFQDLRGIREKIREIS